MRNPFQYQHFDQCIQSNTLISSHKNTFALYNLMIQSKRRKKTLIQYNSSLFVIVKVYIIQYEASIRLKRKFFTLSYALINFGKQHFE